MLLVHYLHLYRYFSELDKFWALSNGRVRPGNPPTTNHDFFNTNRALTPLLKYLSLFRLLLFCFLFCLFRICADSPASPSV